MTCVNRIDTVKWACQKSELNSESTQIGTNHGKLQGLPDVVANFFKFVSKLFLIFMVRIFEN